MARRRQRQVGCPISVYLGPCLHICKSHNPGRHGGFSWEEPIGRGGEKIEEGGILPANWVGIESEVSTKILVRLEVQVRTNFQEGL